MAKEVGKITVKANEDFFDRANQIPRVKDQEFVLKSDYAKSLGKQVSVVNEPKKPVGKTKKRK